ncbi:hypothetical protein [Gimesia aquarii]|uniref:Uncharacterized protein n=1 Tax=Gimesia aquarii TaxID=2527964 RepID=A0A517VPG2_9PLAN|nr:hypothetical protein [Gimesia aquarii]QDT94810.1 hypothetical protein V144x_02420 [Gimesia aquarii]
MNGNPSYQEFMEHFNKVKEFLSCKGEWDLLSLGQKQFLVSQFRELRKSFCETSDSMSLLGLPWVSGESVDNFGDGEKFLVAIRSCTGEGNDYCEWWDYSLIRSRWDSDESVWFEELNGENADFEWESVSWFIPWGDLENTLPVLSGKG